MTHAPQTHVANTDSREKFNVDIIKRTITEKKTTLPSLKNQDRRTLKSETEKVNDLLTNIPTNDITELNDLRYTSEKLVCEKIRVPLKSVGRKSKPGWELRLESQIKRQQVRIQKRNIKKASDETEKARQLESKKKTWGDQQNYLWKKED